MSTQPYDLAVVGGGIVGLALARAALRRCPSMAVLVLEKEGQLAVHQTGHNSGVIHTGVYYKPGSLKAQLCITGARAMRQYCEERGLPMQVRGKVIVATRDSELAGLREVQRRGEANGVERLRWLDEAALREIEPSVAGIAALHVPTAAITDYAAVARSYGDEITAAGGTIRLGAEVIGFQSRADAVTIATRHGDFHAAQVALCGGLQADRLSRLASGADVLGGVRIVPFRGDYYYLSKPAERLVRGLVYPVPDPRFPFLGVHFTPRVHGGVEAGPSAVLPWRAALNRIAFPGLWAMAARYWDQGLAEYYRSLNRSAYVRALQRLIPSLSHRDVTPGGSGVRAQIVLRNGKLMDDFCVRRDGRFLHILNVPSPAATASLTIAEHLADLLPV